ANRRIQEPCVREMPMRNVDPRMPTCSYEVCLCTMHCIIGCLRKGSDIVCRSQACVGHGGVQASSFQGVRCCGGVVAYFIFYDLFPCLWTRSELVRIPAV